ncbi:DUF3137 domain-containing protein [Psychromarinibacter sp. C21-152]|uniref:DUF3137 domain-containing protein n=1 Tax=Psychromarinibacter sediminicola TaxID=3033385 RepID=A0AAE3TA32_9RHOB|nr:DUF3137 domain-containing protein [Psychromarinibacter sediminicola]MDF0601195.1 DUF3137 domain-containing protein [Psychromarinibacter sediminicola]
MDFTERTPLEQGFAPVFRDHVAPALEKIETERLRRLATARKWLFICIGAGVALGAVLSFLIQGEARFIFALVAVGLGVIVGLTIRSAQANAWSGAVEQAVMPAICDHVGELQFSSTPTRDFPVSQMRALGMLGSYDRANLTDELRGTYRDTSYHMVEARLTKKTRDSDNKTKTRTVFDGLLFHIAVPVEAPGRILVARDYGAIGNTLSGLFSGDRGRGMPRVELEHERFERAFEVHADRPDEARAFMPPPFLDSLLAIGEDEGGRKGTKSMVAGFEGSAFYLALARGGSFMKMGGLTTSVTEMEEDLHAIFADIALVRRIIDRLHGEEVGAPA